MNKQQKWSALKSGDCIDFVAPGMRPQPEAVAGLAEVCEAWGLKARFSEHLIGKDLLCANSREFRLKDLKRALKARDSKMIWCLRGGYGSLQLLDGLKRIKGTSPKIFLGLSDITSLHLFFNQHWNWSTIHGCNVDRLALGKASSAEVKRLHDLLFGVKTHWAYRLKPLNAVAAEQKEVRSSIVGGNLITLQSSFGTDYELKTKNRILFFEDIDERAYRVDRVFEQMRQLGLWKNVKAVIFGQFTGGVEPDGRKKVPLLLKQWAREQSFPVLSGIQSGHGPNQHPLPLNTEARLLCGAKPSVQIESGVS